MLNLYIRTSILPLILLFSLELLAKPYCGFVLSAQNIAKHKELDSQRLTSELDYFNSMSYQQLRLLRPSEKKLEASLVYLESLAQSLFRPKSLSKGSYLQKIEMNKLIHEIKRSFDKSEFRVDVIEDLLSSISKSRDKQSISRRVVNRLFFFSSEEVKSKSEKQKLFVKLWSEPLFDYFEEIGFEKKEYGKLRSNFGHFLRALRSVVFNSFSLSSTGVFVDAYTHQTNRRDRLFEEAELYNLSLAEIFKRFNQQFRFQAKLEHGSEVVTKVTHRVAIVFIAVYLSLVHLPHESIYMNKGQLQLEVVELSIQQAGEQFTAERGAQLRIEIMSMSKTELVEKRRELRKLSEKQ